MTLNTQEYCEEIVLICSVTIQHQVFVPNRTEVITGHYPGNYETHEPFRDNYNGKENIIPAQSVNFAPFEKESTQSVIGNEPRLSQSAPASIEKSDPSDLILERTSSEARECMSKTLLSINELDKIRTLFEETKKNLREVYSLASTLTCDTCSSRTKNNSKNVEYKQQNTVRRSVENRQRDIENRLKESQELLRKETEQLKNILQDTKITCTNPMLLFCNDSKDIPETKVTEPTSTRIPAHVQRSILKQPSRSENLRESHKCQAESNKTQLQPEYNLDRDTSSKITVSTDVFLGDDPNPKCSNVTSTYYNKDFLVRSQSENFPDTNTRDIGICTDYNCPVFRKK